MDVLKLSPVDGESDELLNFIAFHSQQTGSPEVLQNLSPNTMLWGDGIVLIDMRACSAFWLHIAKQKEVNLSLLLSHEFEEISKSAGFLATAASTPGEALLLFKAAQEKGFQGIIQAKSRLGRNLLLGLSWDLWWVLYEEYAAQQGAPPALISKARHSMQLALKRLGCQRPDQLRNLPSAHLQRRFGKLVSNAWQLSFPRLQGVSDKDAIALFPWTRFEEEKVTLVVRHLDHELADWPVIEEVLREDLNRLCNLGSFKKEERILNLEWRIVLCNLQELPISILFRHPHSLHKDCPSQRTALLQINYMYEKNAALIAASRGRGLIAWTLKIVEKAPARLRQGSLFQESSDDRQSLRELENMIKTPLEAFALREDWLAEDSYSRFFEHDKRPVPVESENYLPLGRKRPLFLYRQVEVLMPSSISCSRFGPFQERTMDKWWKSEGQNISREYYQLFHNETLLWVYRDQGGTWHTHGVYG
jgi:hypothetical protein